MAEPGLSRESPVPDIEDMDRDEVIEVVRDWFFENYEDPGQSTPYNGREGGYLYVHGGPYDTHEIISTAFMGDIDDELVDEIVADIEAEGGPEWAPAQSRVVPPDDEESAPASNVDAEDRLAKAESAIAELIRAAEVQLDQIERLRPTIGHNQPPEPIDASPLGANETIALRIDLNDLGGFRSKLSNHPAGVSELLTRVREAADRATSYGLTLADVAAKSIAAEAGKIIAATILAHETLGKILKKIVEIVTPLIS